MLKNVNFLNKTVYLFSTELCEALLNERFSNKENNYKDKYSDNTYLIFIRSLNKENKQLVYSYITYNKSFLPALTHYFFTRPNYNSLYFSQWGKYFVIAYTTDPDSLKEKLICYEEKVEDIFQRSLKYGNDSNVFGFINGLTCFTDYENISLLIDLAIKKSYYEYFKVIFSNTTSYETFLNNFNKNLYGLNINLLDHSLYIVHNLKPFLSSIRDKGYGINEGPQKWRGRVSALYNKLSCIDIDYRKSLFNHNQYHHQMSSYPSIPREKFSFNNIHMNLGDVKW